MRATAQDPDTAELVGIDSRAVYARATAIAVGDRRDRRHVPRDPLDLLPATPAPTHLIFAFEAVVIGGLGSSLWGTLLGGIVLGVAQTIGGQINPEYPVLAGHLVFLLVLALAARRPAHAAPASRMSAAASPPQRRARRPGARSRAGRRLSTGFTSGFGVLVVALAFVPVALGASIVQDMTTLLIFVLMAVMWNALAGYGGLVSVGQQAYIGLGAYATVWLADHSVNPYLAMVHRDALLRRRLGPAVVPRAALPRRAVRDRHLGRRRGARRSTSPSTTRSAPARAPR